MPRYIFGLDSVDPEEVSWWAASRHSQSIQDCFEWREGGKGLKRKSKTHLPPVTFVLTTVTAMPTFTGNLLFSFLYNNNIWQMSLMQCLKPTVVQFFSLIMLNHNSFVVFHKKNSETLWKNKQGGIGRRGENKPNSTSRQTNKPTNRPR